MKEVQFDHLGIEVIHVDFARVSLDEKVKVTVPVELKGTPKGEADGGVLQQIINSLEVECLVTEIPEVIRHIVSEMALNDVVHIQDLKLPEGVRVLQDGDLIVATVKEILEVVVAAPEEGAAEPEVIGRKPAEGEEGEAAAGEAPAAEAARKRSKRCAWSSVLVIRAVSLTAPGITLAGKPWMNWPFGSDGFRRKRNLTDWEKVISTDWRWMDRRRFTAADMRNCCC